MKREIEIASESDRESDRDRDREIESLREMGKDRGVER